MKQDVLTGKLHCRDYGDNPDCLGEVDPVYTIDFSDIGEGQILWCSHCGPIAHGMQAAIEEACRTRPGFIEEFDKILTLEEEKAKKELS
jgi:hypothetical protein